MSLVALNANHVYYVTLTTVYAVFSNQYTAQMFAFDIRYKLQPSFGKFAS
jgi:hypothetical protein